MAAHDEAASDAGAFEGVIQESIISTSSTSALDAQPDADYEISTYEAAELHEVFTPREIPSRGTGEEVPIQEACAFDMMPPLLGVQFMINPELRNYAYFVGDNKGDQLTLSHMYSQVAFEQAAAASLQAGNVRDALIAYKAATESGMEFARAVHGIRHLALVNETELDRSGTSHLSPLEVRLSEFFVDTELPDISEYRAFVRTVAQDRLRTQELYQDAVSAWDLHARHPTIPEDADTGLIHEYISLLAKAGQNEQAASIARKMGWHDVAADTLEHYYKTPCNTPAMNRAVRAVERERIKWEIQYSW